MNLTNKQGFTNCIRCGSPRVFSRTWKDKVDGRGSEVTHTESICEDPECQKEVDAKFSAMRERRESSENKRKSIVIAKKAKAQA